MMAQVLPAAGRSVVVQKFGGTSLATPELFARAAARIIATRQSGVDVVVVVSAMAGETDRLLGLAKSFSPAASRRDLDVIASAGEQVSAGLMAMALRAAGARARPFLGHQLGIRTDSVFGSAQIMSVDATRLWASFEADEIPVVAGFQGVDGNGNITTLGRGGSDTTAVAVAASVGATCEIYTDVEGVFAVDPRVFANASRMPVVGYRMMHALAAAGAKVLETRSVALALRHVVPVHVRSSLSSADGTWVVDDADPRVRDVAGIAIARSTLDGIPRANLSVLGPNVSRFANEADEALAAEGVTVFATRAAALGKVYIVSPEDVPAAARALHAIYGVVEVGRSPRRRRETRTEPMERAR